MGLHSTPTTDVCDTFSAKPHRVVLITSVPSLCCVMLSFHLRWQSRSVFACCRSLFLCPSSPCHIICPLLCLISSAICRPSLLPHSHLSLLAYTNSLFSLLSLRPVLSVLSLRPVLSSLSSLCSLSSLFSLFSLSAHPVTPPPQHIPSFPTSNPCQNLRSLQSNAGGSTVYQGPYHLHPSSPPPPLPTITVLHRLPLLILSLDILLTPSPPLVRPLRLFLCSLPPLLLHHHLYSRRHLIQ